MSGSGSSVGGHSPHAGYAIDLTSMAFQKLCKICQLSVWSMPLFLKVHEIVILEGLSKKAACTYVNTEIVAWNKANPTDKKTSISDAAVATHFKNHVPAPLSMNGQIKNSITLHDQGQVPYPPQLEKALKNMNNSVEVQNLDEFQKYHVLVEKVSTRFDQLDKQIGTKGLTVENVMMFRALADLLGKLRKDSMLMRNQERMLTAAVTSALDTYSIGALQGILKSMDQLFIDYKMFFTDPMMADQFMGKLREQLAQNMIASAKVALDAIRQQLKTS